MAQGGGEYDFRDMLGKRSSKAPRSYDPPQSTLTLNQRRSVIFKIVGWTGMAISGMIIFALVFGRNDDRQEMIPERTASPQIVLPVLPEYDPREHGGLGELEYERYCSAVADDYLSARTQVDVDKARTISGLGGCSQRHLVRQYWAKRMKDAR